METQIINLLFDFVFPFVHCSHQNSVTATNISQEIPSIGPEIYPAKLALSMPECPLCLPLDIALFRGIKLLRICFWNLLPFLGKKTPAWWHRQVVVIVMQTGIITKIILYVITLFFLYFHLDIISFVYFSFQVYLMCLFGELCNVPVCQSMSSVPVCQTM